MRDGHDIALIDRAARARDRRRFPRIATDAAATVRIAAGQSLDGRLVDLSQGGACIEFPEAVRAWPGQWVVVAGERPLLHGYDARVVASEGRRLRLAFDPTLVELGVFRHATA